MIFVFGYTIGMTITLLLLYLGYNHYESKKVPSEKIIKNKIIQFMSQRMNTLQNQIDRDVGGGLSDRLAKWQECKYWKEAIERGEFDEDEPDG